MKTPTTKFSSDVTRRTYSKRDAAGNFIGSGRMACWYGRMQVAGGRWQWVKLFTDKRASQREWENRRRATENRQAGISTADIERLALPIWIMPETLPQHAPRPENLFDRYHEDLAAAGKDPDHIRISRFMLGRIFALGGWKTWSDITADNLRAVLAKLAADDATVSYRNKFIARLKAFVNHFLPDAWAHPLRKVKRIREKGAKKTRERRAASAEQLAALFELPLPFRRRLAYAFAALNGLRRNEGRRLIWSDLHLDQSIPHMGIRRKQGQDDSLDFIALHSYVMKLLESVPTAQRSGHVLGVIPDVKTVAKDWKRAGVEFKDDLGRRMDFHALRHTFQTRLDQTGCSRATKKRLMRHAAQDVTDGYAHAELVEMRAALDRLPAPLALPERTAVSSIRAKRVPQPVSNLCPTDWNNVEFPDGFEDFEYPTWVLGRGAGRYSGWAIGSSRGVPCAAF